MSLNFVSKAIQTSTDDGGFEETPIESKDGESGRNESVTESRPLFDQLRANKEQEEEEREEFQRSLMRGTLALDDDDCAHLDAIQRQKEAQKSAVMQQTQDALAAFRAAKADRMLNEKQQPVQDVNSLPEDPEPPKAPAPSSKNTSVKPKIVPKIIVKKKRRRDDSTKESAIAKDDLKGDDSNKRANVADNSAEGKEEKSAEDATAKSGEGGGGGLGALLGGYGSSSDDEE